MTTREPSLSFERLARAPDVPISRRRMELGAVWCAGAGLAGSAPACLLYIYENQEWLPPDGWLHLIVQTITFVVVGGAWCGVVIGAGLSLSTRPLARLLAAVVLGAAAASLLGAIGASHFGPMEMPYFGGPEILGSIGLAILFAAIGFARNEWHITALDAQTCAPRRARTRRWVPPGALALVPAPAVLLVVGTAASIEPHVTGLDLETMRLLVDRLGLWPVGAAGGAVVGAIGAAWFGTAALLASPSQPRRR